VLCSAGASTADRLRALLRDVESLGAISLRVVIAVEIVVAIMAGYEAGGLLVVAALTVGLSAVLALAVVPLRARTATLGRQDLPAR
jgi:ABC-type transport system involved in cytochrome bd biosynthesis fused ATPase/permease subunit